MTEARESKILVTGRLWMGAEARAIGTTLCEIVRDTREELIIVAYRFTVAIDDLTSELEAVLQRGCQVKLVLDNLEEQHPSFQSYVKRLLVLHSNLQTWEFIGEGGALHAKLVISDRKRAVIGSANFSKSGMINNHEMAVLIKGRSALDAARAFDRMVMEGVGSGLLRVATAGRG